MILRYLFTRSEFRGSMILTSLAIGIRIIGSSAVLKEAPEISSRTDSALIDSSEQIRSKARIEINSADSVKLLDLNGIGPVFARRIIRYRQSLGGFAKISQLKEVYGMDSLRLSGFINQITLDTSRLNKMDVNRASFRELLAHPYLEYDHVKSMCRFRESKGILHSPGELWAAGALPDSLRVKLLPYLYTGRDSVEKPPKVFVK
jgi:competence ComEA-like helix-hairpin-helix protein